MLTEDEIYNRWVKAQTEATLYREKNKRAEVDANYHRRLNAELTKQASYFKRLEHYAAQDEEIMSAFVQLITLIQLKSEDIQHDLDLPIRKMKKTSTPKDE